MQMGGRCVARGAGGQSQVAGGGAAEGAGAVGWREPVLAAGSLELAEALAQAGTVPVAGAEQHENQQQQETDGQPRGQGAGGCGAKAGDDGQACGPHSQEEVGAGRGVTCPEKARGSGVTESQGISGDGELGKGGGKG